MSDLNPSCALNRTGRIAPSVLGLLVLLAVAVGVVGYLLIDRGGGADDSESKERSQPSAKSIEAELGGLQEEFQSLLQENLDLSRFEARVRAFTQDHPDQTDGHVLLAQTRIQQEKWEPAYASLNKAFEHDAEVSELQKLAGACAAKLGRLEQAEVHYQSAVRIAGDGADSGVYNALGQIYLTLGDISAAEIAFNRAVKAQQGPNGEQNFRHEGVSGLADVAALRGDYEAAHKSIDRAIRLGNADHRADVAAYNIQKAHLYMDNRQDDEAVIQLEYTWGAFPGSRWRIESARLRARLYERADKLDEAVNHLAEVYGYHQIAPDRIDREVADFVALLAEWQIKAGQANEARISIDNLKTLAPDHPGIESLLEALR